MTDTITPEVPPEKIEPPKVNSPEKNGKRARVFGYTILGFALIGMIAFAIWWIVFRNHEETDDAYVGGNLIVLTPRQEGSVIAYYADDTDLVKQGQLLVQLDSTDYLVAYGQSRAALALAARQVRNLMEDVQERRADVAVQQATYGRAHLDFKNRKGLVDLAAVSKEDYDHSEADLKIAEASLELARHRLQGAIASLGKTEPQNHPMIVQAKSQVVEAYLRVKRCDILSPATGFVAKRAAQVGQSVKTTSPLMSIIPLDHIWVDANFKETQLSDIRIGQKAHVSADIYGGSVSFEGVVGGILPGSGSVFSLLPPQNASGNWIKIVQRIPVRIFLNAKQIQEHPLLLGLSAYVVVDTLDQSGPMLAEQVIGKSLAVTDVFDIPLEQLHVELNELVHTNLGSPSREYITEVYKGSSTSSPTNTSTLSTTNTSSSIQKLVDNSADKSADPVCTASESD